MINHFVAAIGVLSLFQPPPAAPPIAPPESVVERERLIATVRSLPSKRAANGGAEHQAGLRKAETDLAAAFRQLGFEPALDPVDFIGGERGEAPPWNNIVVDITGRSVPKEVLLISAHIDAVVGAPGADDDGTGVAAILEIARLLKDQPMQRTVRLVLFNLEEVGLVGSRAFVSRLQPRIEAGEERIVGMVSLDMLGFYSDTPGSQSNPFAEAGLKISGVADFIGLGGVLRHRHFSQAWVKAMQEAEPACKVEALDFLPIAPRDLLRSDHAPFLAIGVPAVILSDTAEMRSPHYHMPTDTVETLDPERFTCTVRAVVGAVHRLAGPEGSTLIDLAPPPSNGTGKPARP